MPCYSVQLKTIDFVVGSRPILEQSVKELGWTIIDNVIQTPQGRIFLRDKQVACEAALMPLVNQLRVVMTRNCVKAATKMTGWGCLANNKEQTTFTVSRGM